jgi:hypothetical protein
MRLRLSLILAFAVAGMLCLLHPLPAQSGMAIIERERDTQTPAAAKSKTSARPKGMSSSAKPENSQSSAFVALSCLILDAAPVSGNAQGFGIASFEPALVDHILDAGAAGWMSGSPGIGGEAVVQQAFSIGPTNGTPGQIEIQPLVVRKASRAFEEFEPKALYPADDFYPSEELNGFESSNVFRSDTGSREMQAAVSQNTGKSSKSPFSYTYKKDQVGVNTGISWINDLTDSRGLSQTFQKAGFESSPERLPGINLNLGASYRAFSLTGGYIHALERYAPAQPSVLGNEIDSGAWSSEFAYTTELLRKETVLAVGYQKSSESLKSYLPEQRYTTKASMAIFDGTTFSLEYYFDKDYSVKNGGVNGDGYGVTTRIGFEFQ